MCSGTRREDLGRKEEAETASPRRKRRPLFIQSWVGSVHRSGRQRFGPHGHCEQESRCRKVQSMFRVRGVNNAEGLCMCGSRACGESLHTAQFCSESETALKTKVYTK